VCYVLISLAQLGALTTIVRELIFHRRSDLSRSDCV
jgi:hypothetical protein